MIDIKLIRENPEIVKQAIKAKNAKVDIDLLLKLDQQRRELMQKIEQLNADKKEAAKSQNHEQGKKIKAELQQTEKKMEPVKNEFNKILSSIPNIPSKDTPIGKDENDNVVLRKVGEPPKFSFQPKTHDKIGEDLGILDPERAIKVSGSRFAYLKGDLARMEFALVQLTLDTLTDEKKLKEIIEKNNINTSSNPFIPIIPPVMIRPEIMKRMGRHDPEEMYYLERDDLNLIGSAEHTTGSIYADEILDEKELPIRYIAFSSAFRREAGSYGKDMKGILRLHQFDKLEMETFTTSEKGRDEQDLLVAIQEYLTQQLELPYQAVAVCSGDMGTPDTRQIDIETWMPGQNKYRETHSADYVSDYQARRLNTRVKRKDGSKEFVHMNDATAFAGRTLIAILENYQQEDGSVVIPEVLRKYMGEKERIERGK